MQDVLEGMSQYEMKRLRMRLIDKYAASKEVHRRTKSFNYG